MLNLDSDSDGDDNNNQLLDVEGDHARQRRLERLLRRTNCTASHMPSNSNQPRMVPQRLPGSSSSLDNHLPIQPPTELLARLEAFLPQMASANSELLQRAQQNPESVNIEHIDDTGDGRYIEMNLGLGVYTMRHRRQSDASHTSNSSSDDSDSSVGSTKLDNPQAQSDVQFNRSRKGSASSNESSDDYESDSGGNGGHTDTATMLINAVSGSTVSGDRPIRALPKRAAPCIVVLNEEPVDEDQV